ncbi:hypothetical protein [Aliirhizobium cellulosilyticum]|uniref:Uncharacterized protein n=1 Tax=Aliirhizobium cellulosilyticum TaxID=393664 RepID=A0A7W6UYZ8_9HYPH|nr:hypothetical protein [Rhizobium cellulosilyticum]MBB4349466.1 hypothetical protein [Rhizobium cellulosilyticum]MBB4412312.1 hypothetical protein [Rhizobium cellulosilyticum]MBB4446943.1 hypothetical protein [Rhizobium cellulosilyticum]
MNVSHTRVVHEGAGKWIVDFIIDDGESVSVKVTDEKLAEAEKVIDHAKRITSELAN